jgi:RNAse (barnase) inhibitor barstar
MKNNTRFIFSDHYNDDEKVFLARLDRNIFTQEQLLDSLYKCLKFPFYFGFNWNALFDCVKDFNWITEFTIVLVHKELPQICECDLKIYLEILTDATDHWKSVDGHNFEVIFSKKDQLFIMQLMSNSIGAVG